MAAEDADILGRQFSKDDFGPDKWRVIDVHAEVGNVRPDLVWVRNERTGVKLLLDRVLVRGNLVPA